LKAHFLCPQDISDDTGFLLQDVEEAEVGYPALLPSFCLCGLSTSSACLARELLRSVIGILHNEVLFELNLAEAD
jgi:hypothetical protein